MMRCIYYTTYINRSLQLHNVAINWVHVRYMYIARLQGLMSHDRVLAGALWRAFFESRIADPILLEQMVHYVRKQVLYHTETNLRYLLLFLISISWWWFIRRQFCLVLISSYVFECLTIWILNVWLCLNSWCKSGKLNCISFNPIVGLLA